MVTITSRLVISVLTIALVYRAQPGSCFFDGVFREIARQQALDIIRTYPDLFIELQQYQQRLPQNQQLQSQPQQLQQSRIPYQQQFNGNVLQQLPPSSGQQQQLTWNSEGGYDRDRVNVAGDERGVDGYPTQSANNSLIKSESMPLQSQQSRQIPGRKKSI